MAELTPAEVYQTAVKAGWSTTPDPSLVYAGRELSPAEVIAAIANAESGNNTNALNPGGGSDTEVSVGLTQLNIVGGAGSGYSPQELTDPLTNLKVALAAYNSNLKSGMSPLEAFQQPWGAELGKPGGSIGNQEGQGYGANYQSFVVGLLPFLTRNIPDVGADYEDVSAPNLVAHDKTYTFSEVEQLISSRLKGMGGTTSGGTVSPSGTASGAGGSTGTASTTSTAGTGQLSAGGFVSSVMRDIEVGALVVGAAAGLFLAVSHLASGGVSLPGIGARVSIASGTPELWWVVGSASAVVLWSVFTKQNPFCVFTHLSATAPGSCAGTLQGGQVIETLLALWGGSKLFPSLLRLFPGGGGVAPAPSGSEGGSESGSGTSTGTGPEEGSTGGTEADTGMPDVGLPEEPIGAP